MPPGRRLVVVDKPERTQTQMLVATLGTSPHDDDHVPILVANAVFGGTFTSRLMKEIRSKRGWSYGASTRAGVDRRRQSWVMWTFPSAEDAAPCLKLSVELLETWVSGGVTARELAFIQRYLVRSHAFEIDTATKRLHQALDVECISLPPDYFTGWLDRVRAVTAESGERRRSSAASAPTTSSPSSWARPRRSSSPSARRCPRMTEASVVPFDAE